MEMVLDDDIDGDGITNDDDDDIDGDGVLNAVDNLTSVSEYSIFIQSLNLTIESLCPGEYYVIGLSTNGDGCETLLEFFEISEYENLTIESIVTYDVECYGYDNGFAEITVSGGSSGQSYDVITRWS